MDFDLKNNRKKAFFSSKKRKESDKKNCPSLESIQGHLSHNQIFYR